MKHQTVVYDIKRVADDIEKHIGHFGLSCGDEMDEKIWERTRNIWIFVSLITLFDMTDERGML